MDGRRIGETGPPTSLNSWRRGRRGATSLGPTRDGGGRRAGGPGSGMRLLLLRNESRPSERVRPRPYFLPCLLALPGLALAVPCSRCCSALALSSASAFLPFVYVLLFIGRTAQERDQSREEKTTFAACWLLLLLQPPACVSPCRPTVTLYTSFMEDMLIFFFV